jgi:hypothetical protein
VAAIGFSQMGALRNTTEDLDNHEVRAQALAARADADSLEIGQKTAARTAEQLERLVARFRLTA